MVTHHPVDLPCPGPSAVPVVLSQDERTELKARAQSPDRRRAERARIVLACADGLSNMGAARSLGVAVKTVAKWRRRFAAEGVAGLDDACRMGRPKADLVLDDDERAQLTRWARRAKTAQFLALRSKIVLRCAEGGTNRQAAAELGIDESTVERWRARFITHRLHGLHDEPRPGRPPSIHPDQIEDVVVATLRTSPGADSHWTRAAMAERTGLSKSTIGRIWKRFDLKPHLQDAFELSTEPQFTARPVGLAGLYHYPPEKTVVLCVDGSGRIAAPERSPRPPRPMVPGAPGPRPYDDDLRHGISSLFGTAGCAGGRAVGAPRGSAPTAEFRKFLATMEQAIPTGLDVHLVCDNHATHSAPEISAWLAERPRFHVHFTPADSSWTDQIDQWFGLLADPSVPAVPLGRDIAAWAAAWADSPQPFAWARPAEELRDALAGPGDTRSAPGPAARGPRTEGVRP
ncbi:IS630 family transposase [Streptomyces microflavus]|uniref:GntR family DNA-binding regulator n=1 Tax=Streptomyces microflavus DSM 40593 TaxID=1303692 RepID=N0D010_STRMI|nr:IS630 family transposase [Streptomyces microflavus]AGK81691.1 GntR family DNA-binding regulator [Streptomyces microflavus DSM 40593]